MEIEGIVGFLETLKPLHFCRSYVKTHLNCMQFSACLRIGCDYFRITS